MYVKEQIGRISLSQRIGTFKYPYPIEDRYLQGNIQGNRLTAVPKDRSAWTKQK
jgi:hypothetical protein